MLSHIGRIKVFASRYLHMIEMFLFTFSYNSIVSHRATQKDPTIVSMKACPLLSSVQGLQVRCF